MSRRPRSLRSIRPTSIALAALVSGSFGVFACTAVLGYNDLSPRALSVTDAQPEVFDAPVAETVADTITETLDSAPAEIPVRPPARPTGEPTASGKGKTLWLIVQHFYLNTQNSSGVTVKGAWRDWGYDLDRVCTGPRESTENTGTCQRVPGAPPDVLLDGDGCRDNNFGSQLVPLLSLYDAVFETTSNDAIAKGNDSWILVLDDLDEGPSDPYAPGRLYKASRWADYGRSVPAFDGTDLRQIDGSSVVDGDVTKARTVFPKGYVQGNVWVSGEGAPFRASVPIDTVKSDMNLVGAYMTLQLSADHKTGGLGLLAGALPLVEVEPLMRPIAAAAGFCPGSPIYTGLLKTVGQYMDLVSDAPNLQSTSVACDAMSMGIGLAVAPIQPATQVVAPPPPLATCDAGVDSGP